MPLYILPEYITINFPCRLLACINRFSFSSIDNASAGMFDHAGTTTIFSLSAYTDSAAAIPFVRVKILSCTSGTLLGSIVD